MSRIVDIRNCKFGRLTVLEDGGRSPNGEVLWDGWECQKCGAGVEAELHCHHITGVEQNPVESADIDNCTTLCKKHHKWSHTLPGCKYFELKCKNLTLIGR